MYCGTSFHASNALNLLNAPILRTHTVSVEVAGVLNCRGTTQICIECIAIDYGAVCGVYIQTI